MDILIRHAVPSDASQLAEIYNRAVVLERNSTFETEPRSVENRQNWIKNQDEHYPILVAEMEGKVVGWSSVSHYRTRECYKGIGEFSVYIHYNYRGKGIGKKLLTALEEECKKLGFWKLVSRIFDFNQGSRSLCKSCGFREVGIYQKHGKLNGHWIDCVIVEKLIEKNLI